jgi:Fe2+ transport system protein FeoA
MRERRRHGQPSLEDKTCKTKIIPLRELSTGSTGTINRLSCRRHLRRRLMDMGVVAGTPVKIERVAPLGDPIELKLKGFHLSLRREEAGDIWVEVPEDER